MKKTSHKNLQRQIGNLITLIELCLPLIEEVDRAKAKLTSFPTELEQLKKQAELLKVAAYTNSVDSQSRSSQIEETEFELDFLVNDLEGFLLHLATLQHKINNLTALRERIEALQEERLDNITPERIYRLLEKQQLALLGENEGDERSPQPDNGLTDRFQGLWQKIANYKHTRRLVKGTAIATGIILCFSAISYSSMKYQLIEHKPAETEELDDSVEI